MNFEELFKENFEKLEKIAEEKKVDEPKRIESEAELDIYVGIFNNLKDQESKIKDHCKELKKAYNDKIKEYEDREMKSIDMKKDYVSGLIKEFYKRQDYDSRLKLVNGTVGYYKKPDKLNYVGNQEEISKKLMELDESLVRIKYEPNKNEVKKKVEVVGDKVYLNGEELEGIEFEQGEEKFEIR